MSVHITWHGDHGTFSYVGESGKIYNFFTPYSAQQAQNEDGIFAVCMDVLSDVPFGRSNNFGESAILIFLKDFFEDIAFGEETFYDKPFYQDLTSIYEEDGSYEEIYLKDGVSIPNVSFFRQYEYLFNKFPTEKSWWLSTPNGIGKSKENSSIFVPPSRMNLPYNDKTTLQYASSRSSCGVRPLVCLYPDNFTWG